MNNSALRMNSPPAPGELESSGFLGMLSKLRTDEKSPLADLFPEPLSHMMNSKNANAKSANANMKSANAKSAKGGRKNKTRKSSKRASRKRRVH
jgi:hypothetical protein